MADIVSPEKRSKMMSGIRSGNTRPEIMVRKALFSLGYRYRSHPKDLPGKPDIKLPKYRSVVFINGCFWHGHDCHLFKMPSTRREFWEKKINGNQDRDKAVLKEYDDIDWRTACIWECAIRGKGSIGLEKTIASLTKWLHNCNKHVDIRGNI